MVNKFELNGVTVVAKKFDFNMICDLEDMGVSLQEAQSKPMNMVRAYIAICLGCSIDQAGQEMETHLIGGGSFEDVMSVMAKEMETSDFFRNLNQPKTATKKATKAQTKTE